MGLIKKFNDKVQGRKTASEIRNKERRNKQMEAWAKKLLGKIDKYRKKGQMEHYQYVGYQYADHDFKSYPCYKQLHEMCATANVQISIENRRYHNSAVMGGSTSLEPAIVIDLGKPYSTSPDADILSSKKPVWVQPPLPGL